MRIAVVGAGAVGGYFAAKLSRAGEDVAVVARGAHLEAIRRDGLQVRSPALGDFAARVAAEADPAAIGAVDLVVFAVKTYDTAEALHLVPPLLHGTTAVLTLQNGVDSADEVAAAVGETRVLGGVTYVATSIAGPGVIAQTGVHRSIVFGEAFGERPHAAAERRVAQVLPRRVAHSRRRRPPLRVVQGAPLRPPRPVLPPALSTDRMARPA